MIVIQRAKTIAIDAEKIRKGKTQNNKETIVKGIQIKCSIKGMNVLDATSYKECDWNILVKIIKDYQTPQNLKLP